MRVQNLLNTLAERLNPNIAKVTHFTTNPNFFGGWELWLQAEIAYAFTLADPNNRIDREHPYPSGVPAQRFLRYGRTRHPTVNRTNNAAQAAKADFRIHREHGMADTTFVELKCLNARNGLADAYGRFSEDVSKITDLCAANGHINCAALLATFGNFTNLDLHQIRWCWAGHRVARVLDYHPGGFRNSQLRHVNRNGPRRFFIIGVGL